MYCSLHSSLKTIGKAWCSRLWQDQLQSSMCSPCPMGSASNPFQLDMCTGKGAGLDELDKEQGSQQNHKQPRCVSSGLEDMPVSLNTLVDLEIDPYPDDAIPIGLLASLVISSSRDNTGMTLDKMPKTDKVNNAPEEDDIMCLFFFPGVLQSGLMIMLFVNIW